jgi:hypothetical protein
MKSFRLSLVARQHDMARSLAARNASLGAFSLSPGLPSRIAAPEADAVFR